MAEDIFELLSAVKEKKELAALVSMNEKTEKFGLSLTAGEARELVVCRNSSLRKYQRVEFTDSILNKLIFTFCDSQYIHQDNYLETIEELLDVFYGFKNEAADLLTDDELLEFMREQFETVCYGDKEYLSETCLERFAAAIRAGYDGYQKSEGKGEYERFSQELRWDKEVYFEVVRDLFW